MKIPNNFTELRDIEKKNNVIVKLNSNSKLNGIYPAYRKVCRWCGYLDKWDIYFVAAKSYHSLLDTKLKTKISYDKMMDNLKLSYRDEFCREVRIFKNKSSVIDYLTK